MLRQIGECMANAHNAASRITYVHRDFPDFAEQAHRSADRELSL